MKRILYMDAIKAFAMFLVLLGHNLFYYGKIIESSHYLHETIYMFHMPLFMLLCGFFAESSFKKSFWIMVHTKFIQLIIPVITSAIIVCSFMYIIGDSKINILTEIIGGNWFLKTLFICYLIGYISIHLFKGNTIIAFLFSWILLCLIPYGSTLQINWMYLFFWLGICLKKDISCIMNHRRNFALLSFTTFVICAYIHFHYQIPNYIELNIQTIVQIPLRHLLRIITAISGSLTIILIFSWIYERYEHNRFLLSIAESGKYTLGIYVLQTFILQRLIIYYIPSIDNPNHYLFSFLYMPLLSIVVYIICILIIKLLSKNKYCDLMAFGGQYYRFSK